MSSATRQRVCIAAFVTRRAGRSSFGPSGIRVARQMRSGRSSGRGSTRSWTTRRWWHVSRAAVALLTRKPILALAIVGAIALAGCSAPAPEEAVPFSSEPSQASTPTLTPTPIAEPVDPRVEAAKADRQRFLDMSLDEFTALPDAEKVLFVALTNVAFFEDYESS